MDEPLDHFHVPTTGRAAEKIVSYGGKLPIVEPVEDIGNVLEGALAGALDEVGTKVPGENKIGLGIEFLYHGKIAAVCGDR